MRNWEDAQWKINEAPSLERPVSVRGRLRLRLRLSKQNLFDATLTST
jgi:hypothetical protein